MIQTLGLIAVQFAILAVVGWAAIALLPRRHRELLLPGVPLLGAALVAVVMTTTTHFTSALPGAVAVIVLTAALLVVAARRAPEGLRLGRRSVAAAVLVTVVSGVGTAVALVPSYWAGDNRATPVGGTLDLYYYTAESDWIAHHSVDGGPHIGPRPGTGNATPAYRPMEVANIAPLRAGQAMVVSALDAVMGTNSVDTITPAVVLWVLLIGSGAAVSALLLGFGLRVALVAALVGNGSAMVLSQYFSGNADALLGTGLALVTIASVLAALDRRLGIWIPALSAAALVAVYTEFALYVAPAVAGGLLVRSWTDLKSRAVRLLSLSALAVVIAPFGWTRGVATLLMDRSTAGMGMPSPFYSDGRYAAFARFLGVQPLTQMAEHRWPGYLAAAVVLGGLVLALVLRPERGAWFALLLVGAAYIGHLTLDHAGYVHFRAVQLIGALVFFVTVVGYAAGVAWLRPRLRARGRGRGAVVSGAVVPGAVAALVALVLVGTNLDNAYALLDKGTVQSRHVDGSFDQAAGWVDRLGGPEGRDVTVLNPDIASQLWMAYALSQETLVSWPALHISYLGPSRYWAGEIDPYVLAGPGAFVAGDRSAVVRRNNRYRLVSLEGHRTVVAAPIDLVHWDAYRQPDGSMPGSDGAQLLVETGTEPTGPVTLRIWVPGKKGRPLRAMIDGVVVGTTTTRPGGPSMLTIDLGHRRSAVVDLDIEGSAAPGNRTLFLQKVSLEH